MQQALDHHFGIDRNIYVHRGCPAHLDPTTSDSSSDEEFIYRRLNPSGNHDCRVQADG